MAEKLTADDGPDRESGGEGRSEDADRPGTLPGVLEQLAENRQPRRQQSCPARPREAMRSSGEGDSAALVEPRPNTAVPAMSNLSLPNRSPRFPKAMSRELTTKP